MTNNVFTRMTGAVALGAAVTAAVLLLMQTLIESDQAPPDEVAPVPAISFVRVLEDEPLEPVRQLPEPPRPPDTPPPPPDRMTRSDPHQTIGTEVRPPDLNPPDTLGSWAMVDGDALPVVKVRPVYPDSAATRGIEGHVLVEFTIDELGRVVDVVVLEAEPRGIFERAALRAVERFRYKPRVVNGSATPVSGVQHLVTFRLDA